KIDEGSPFESTTVGVYRTAATVKGGRRFSFSSLVVVGDRAGRIGVGYGKANQVPPAIEKAQKEARRKMQQYPMTGHTLPHAVTGRYGACVVRMLPASPGTGVIAGAAVRAPLELLGVQDCLTKSFGSNNPKNLVKAVIAGLEQLRSKTTVETLRGVTLEMTEVEEAIERGQAQVEPAAVAVAAPPAEAPAPAPRKDAPRRDAPKKDAPKKDAPKVEAAVEPAPAATAGDEKPAAPETAATAEDEKPAAPEAAATDEKTAEGG
ncbi:MAG: 30S ribosomal protein S5, partial [Planctomycetota bacterium]